MSEAVSRRRSTHEPTEISQPSDLENQVSRLFHAPRERVFRLFTDPATLPVVWSPDPRRVTVESVDFRRGGRYAIHVRGEDGTSTRFTGEFLEFDPPRRVVNTLGTDTSPGLIAVETDDFESVGDDTRVTIRWKFQRREDRDKMYGHRMKTDLTAMWDRVADMLDEGAP
jgi:uncharacterized protein YndB with AHSA1/START domain